MVRTTSSPPSSPAEEIPGHEVAKENARARAAPEGEPAAVRAD
nr:hypothetical protein [Acetobacter persici]